MKKYTGQILRRDLDLTQIKLNNIIYKIDKKFDLVINDYSKYISDDHKSYIKNSSIYDLNISKKLDIIIQAEDNYIKLNGKQIDIFT